MKFCPYCGATLPAGAISFCPECGKPLNTPLESYRSEFIDPAQSQMLTQNQPETQEPPSQLDPGDAKHSQPLQHRQRPSSNSLHNRSVFQTQNKNKPVASGKKQKPRSGPKPYSKANHRQPSAPTERNLMDINYDGYYNDVPTDDNARTREGIDSELMKRIVMIASGALIIVAISIIIMNVL